mmetsp:Transcript_29048/g.86917  ORF Transcript_29048/g.86917 Transcript_29048/m.86917 type:complete len:127 (-) Transcript_29048:278-658(-)
MIIKREREMSDAARQFDRDLNLERIEHQRQVTEKKNAIVLLKQQLQCVRSKTTVDAKYYRKEAHAQTCSLVRAFQQSERAQGIKINELEKKSPDREGCTFGDIKFSKGKAPATRRRPSSVGGAIRS